MKHLILLAALVASGCAATQVRDHALVPALQLAWSGVKADLEAGLSVAATDGIDAGQLDALHEDLDRFDAALTAEDLDDLALIPWSVLESWAIRGVQWRVESGEIGEGVASSLYERIINFRQALDSALGRPVSRLEIPNTRERHDIVRAKLGLPTLDTYLYESQAEYEQRIADVRARDVRSVRYQVGIIEEVLTRKN